MADFDAWADHHSDNRSSEEADQLEWLAFIHGSCAYDGTQLDDEVSGELLDYRSAGESEAEDRSIAGETPEASIERKLRESNRASSRKDLRREDLVAGVRREVARRSTLLGDVYPFDVNPGSISFRGDGGRARRTYLFCLKLATDPTAPDRAEFENVTAAALQSYLGSGARSFSFGWKGLTEADQPRRIREKFIFIEEETGEWPWDPEEGFPADPPPKLVKDLGLDAMSWLPSPDGRLGQIFLLAQCATGRTDWEDKLGDVSWPRMEHWIRPVPKGWTIRCFAIPFHIPNSGKLKEVSGRGGLFLDRARIALLLRE